MKNSSKAKGTGSFWERILTPIKNSLIISSLDRLCLKIYEKLCTGWFAKLFTGADDKSIGFSSDQSTNKNTFAAKMTEKIARKIEDSKIVTAVGKAASAVFGLRLRIIGVYLITFAIYTGLFALLKLLLGDGIVNRYESYPGIVSALTLAFASIPFLVSKGTLSNAFTSSKICMTLVKLCGFSESKVWSEESRGKLLPAFLLGMLSGIASLVIAPFLIFIAVAAVIFLYLVLCVPEFGLMCMFFLMPFIPTMALAGLTILVFLAFTFKVIRGKRVLRFGRIDLMVLAFGGIIFFGGTVSHSFGSIMPAMMFLCFLSSYFLISCCVRSSEWLNRLVSTMVFSAMIVAFYGIIQYVLNSSGAGAWLDSTMFAGISGRATSTLENPNMLGEYLIMIIPTAFALFLTSKETAKKLYFACFACMGMCLILTWSRGAWLGFLFSAVIFLLIWKRRSIWLFIGGILAIPVLPIILPDSIINRFTSIGSLADTSTSYRVNVWRGAMRMLEDYLFSGIGTGEAAWYELYPEYSLSGIEAAPHSHNLFIQIALENGIFALIVFLAILVMLIRISLTLFSRLSKGCGNVLSKDETLRHKLLVAGPLCGLGAVLIQGFTDYSWYNYRVYLMFWMALALIPALVKNARSRLNTEASILSKDTCNECSAAIDIDCSSEDNR